MGATTARQLKGSGSLPPRQRRLDGRSARSSPLLDEAMLPSRDETTTNAKLGRHGAAGHVRWLRTPHATESITASYREHHGPRTSNFRTSANHHPSTSTNLQEGKCRRDLSSRSLWLAPRLRTPSRLPAGDRCRARLLPAWSAMSSPSPPSAGPRSRRWRRPLSQQDSAPVACRWRR